MYCIKCGVKLADSEKKCPLCCTAVCHPDFDTSGAVPLYPLNKIPKSNSRSKVLCGAIIIMFLIPLIVCFFSDLQGDGRLNWFGYVTGALILSYTVFALPLWFKKPNPVIFMPCNFAAAILYLLYINLVTGGDWFLSFAFPVAGGLCLICCTLITLMYYLHTGKLYIIGGAFILLGGLMLLIEFLADITFHLSFIGWSIYPMVVLILFGGLLIYFAINGNAREAMERKLFF